MHYIGLALFSLGFFVANGLALPSESHATTLRDCPSESLLVVNKQDFATADGRSLAATTYSCANGDSTFFDLRALSLGHTARQNPEICTQTCLQSCHVFGSTSNVPNCTDLISVVNSLDGQTFLAPPNTITLFEIGQCSTRFFHGLSQPVNVCFSWLSGLLPTMNTCFATPPQNAAECSQENVDFSFDLTLIFPGALN